MEYTKSRTLNNVIDNTLIVCAIILAITSVTYAFYKYEEYAYAETHDFETGCPYGTECAEHERLKCHSGRIVLCVIMSITVGIFGGGGVAAVVVVLFLCYRIGVHTRRTFHHIVQEYDEYDARVTEEQKSRIQ